MSITQQYNEAEALALVTGDYTLADQLFAQIEDLKEEATLYGYGE